MVAPLWPLGAREALELGRLEVLDAQDGEVVRDRAEEGFRRGDDAVVLQELEWEAEETGFELETRALGVVAGLFVEGPVALDAWREGPRLASRRARGGAWCGGEPEGREEVGSAMEAGRCAASSKAS